MPTITRWAHVGFTEAHDTFAPGFYRALRMSFATWAPQLLCRHTYFMQYIIYILQSFEPSAGPRAYAHYIRPHKAHPSLTNCISAKVQPFQLLYRYTYNMQHIIYILQSFGPSAGLREYAHYIGSHIVHPSLTHCISAKVGPSGTL